MGWSIGHDPRPELIRQLLRPYETRGHTARPLRHCYRGNSYSGVLWSVWEVLTDDGVVDDRYIRCDLLRRYDIGWGYKDLTEWAQPYYYSCPVGYLDLVQPEEYTGTCPEWRAWVRQAHEATQAKRRATLRRRRERAERTTGSHLGRDVLPPEGAGGP